MGEVRRAERIGKERSTPERRESWDPVDTATKKDSRWRVLLVQVPLSVWPLAKARASRFGAGVKLWSWGGRRFFHSSAAGELDPKLIVISELSAISSGEPFLDESRDEKLPALTAIRGYSPFNPADW